MAHPIPVTVVCGFTGAGKSALLRHVLDHAGGRRVAALAGELEAALAEAEALAAAGGYDAVLIEADGTDEPLPIAQAMAFDAEAGESGSASAATRLDTLVTVIDAATFLPELHEAAYLRDRGLAPDDEDDRTVVDVLIGQVECCDILVVNHADRIDAPALARLLAVLQALNPRADRIVTTFGAVAPERVLATGAYDIGATSAAPGWQAELRGEAVAAQAGHGIGSLVYRRRRPFHPQRFASLIHSEWLREHGDVWRSRGIFWLATRMDIAGEWNQAGGVCRHGGAGAWWAAIDRADWPTDAASLADIEAEMLADPRAGGQPATFGDRRQELVLIGEALDPAALERRLDDCLLTDEEMAAGPGSWVALDDPFPDWDEDEHEHGHEDQHARDHAEDGHGHAPGQSHDHGAGDRPDRRHDNGH